MSKIFSLLQNELIKIFCRITTWIMVVLLLFSMTVYSYIEYNFFEREHDYHVTMMSIEEEKKYVQDNIENMQKHNASQKEIIEQEQIIWQLEKLEAVGFRTPYNKHFIAAAIEDEAYFKNQLEFNKLGEEFLIKQWDVKVIENNIAALEKIIQEKDFFAYLAWKKTYYQQDETLAAYEKDHYVQALEIWRKFADQMAIDSPENNNAIYNLMQSYIDLSNTLSMGIEWKNGFNFLMPEKEMKIREKLLILEEHVRTKNLEVYRDGEIYAEHREHIDVFIKLFDFGFVIILILIIIIAGSSISHELSSGSIKSLIIAPVKRWKIYVAKFLAVIVSSAIFILINYSLALLLRFIFFPKGFLQYYYVVNDVVKTTSFILLFFYYAIAHLIPLLCYAIVAFMLSTVVRISTLAIALPLSGYFAKTFFYVFGNVFAPKAEWLKFIPYTHLNIVNHLFPMFIRSDMQFKMSVLPYISLSFNVGYILVVFFCLFYIGLDSFNRRDIS